jgi:hypothetical protein
VTGRGLRAGVTRENQFHPIHQERSATGWLSPRPTTRNCFLWSLEHWQIQFAEYPDKHTGIGSDKFVAGANQDNQFLFAQ